MPLSASYIAASASILCVLCSLTAKEELQSASCAAVKQKESCLAASRQFLAEGEDKKRAYTWQQEMSCSLAAGGYNLYSVQGTSQHLGRCKQILLSILPTL
jgi:hypothetical protein